VAVACPDCLSVRSIGGRCPLLLQKTARNSAALQALERALLRPARAFFRRLSAVRANRPFCPGAIARRRVLHFSNSWLWELLPCGVRRKLPDAPLLLPRL